ncbi:MAG: hypothetical protein HYR94_04305, partial [Chloroflexi bacterium]|nr:hypothetical protein [Chloroflexota bacterium]
IFYPFVFLMRVTPVALLGLAVYILRLASYVLRFDSKRSENHLESPYPSTLKASLILVIYIVVYSLAMTLGSHKQDRYLMPVFLSVDILAAMGLVSLWNWVQKKGVGSKKVEVREKTITPPLHAPRSTLHALRFAPYAGWVQFATVLPHHPYYYSYFNPLMGDGSTAVRTMRIGWGEGMDQVGAYLADKPNSRQLVVASRFTHNMLNFKGEQISLLPDGRWTQADYIVLYIQQVQRRQEPSPGFIDYFQAQPPEKVITIGGIDYAWIYPRPFSVSANPSISVMPNQAALLGYRWEDTRQIRLWWEHLGLSGDRELMARLVGRTATSEWVACQPDPAFLTQAQTPGAYVESLCAPALAGLPPGPYTVEFGLASLSFRGEVDVFVFPEGWQAVTMSAAGEARDTPQLERLEAIAGEVVPATAPRLDRIYDGRIRLVAYQLNPASPQPGQTLNLTLYWQLLRAVAGPLHLIVQWADSRSLPLGRLDAGLPADQWLPGEVITTRHPFELAADLESPLAGQVEVTLQNEAEVSLQPTTAAGKALEAGVARFTVAPERRPTPAQAIPAERAVWQNGLVATRRCGRGYPSACFATGFARGRLSMGCRPLSA